MTPTEIRNLVIAEYGITEWSLVSNRRTKRLAEARMACTFLIRSADELITLTELGSLIGKHHTTVMYQLDQARRRLTTDRSFTRRINRLRLAMHRAEIERSDAAVDSWLKECGI